MSNDHALEMVLSKILNFNKEITTRQQNKKKVNKKHKKALDSQIQSEKTKSIKKIEDYL